MGGPGPQQGLLLIRVPSGSQTKGIIGGLSKKEGPNELQKTGNMRVSWAFRIGFCGLALQGLVFRVVFEPEDIQCRNHTLFHNLERLSVHGTCKKGCMQRHASLGQLTKPENLDVGRELRVLMV